MSDDPGVTLVNSSVARCTGGKEGTHPPIEIVLAGRLPASCPHCGRRFQQARGPGSVLPAVWPKDE